MLADDVVPYFLPVDSTFFVVSRESEAQVSIGVKEDAALKRIFSLT